MIPKKAQLDVSFNWIYILIAGVVILLFFTGIIVRQKAASEQQLSTDAVRIMGSIFTAAGVSEKTKNSIDISGLADYTLTFNCEDDVGEYGIKDGYRVQNAIEPVFAPLEIQGTRLSLWSLPYTFPFKVIDFLFITSENTKYFFLGQDYFIDEFLDQTAADEKIRFHINAERINNLDEVQPGNNFQIRMVDFSHTIREGLPVPVSVRQMEDDKVTAIVFSAAGQADYYQKQDAVWMKLNRVPVPIISLAGERDAAKYAAIFAGNDQVYQCNMQKVFRRLKLLNEVYGGKGISVREVGGKLQELVAYYTVEHPALEQLQPDCIGHLSGYPENLVQALASHQNHAAACLLQPGFCIDLISSALQVQELNERLRQDCLTLY